MIDVNRSFPEGRVPGRPAKFRPGQLVRHKRYGYRGVIVAADPYCKADPAWYMANKTQPDRDQPWYHVLVHDSASCTYAAESSLGPDTIAAPVNHPLVPQFFEAFTGLHYLRNDEEWPA